MYYMVAKLEDKFSRDVVAECLLARCYINKMYDLVANPEDRVFRDVAHFRMVNQFIAVHQLHYIHFLSSKKKFKLRNEQLRNK